MLAGRGSRLHRGDVSLLKSWERDTRLEGSAMAIVLLLALMAPFLAVGMPRRLAVLLVVTSAVLVAGPIVVHDYDYRYVIPAFGPLTAGAAIAAHGLWRRLPLAPERGRLGVPA